MISQHIAKAIELINPSAKFTIWNDDTTSIDWLDGTTPISQEDIEAKIPEAEEIFNSKKYKLQRLEEYPSLQDCIHALLDGGDTLTELQEKRQTVKTKYPKP